MEHALDKRWRIAGRFSDHVILRNPSAEDLQGGQQVPQAFITSLLEQWLTSGASRTLYAIYESLGGHLPVGLTVLERGRYEQKLKERLREAFSWGGLVALEIKHPLPHAWPVALAKPLPKSPPPEPEPEPERTFIVIKLVDEEGNPMAGTRYRVELPDGSTRTGTLNSSGEARENHVVAGECKVTFPDLEDATWEPGGAAAQDAA